MSYEGPVTAIASDGETFDITAELHVENEPFNIGDRSYPLSSWLGEGRLPADQWRSSMLGFVTLRLPDGGEAGAAITAGKLHGEEAVVTIAGTGRPPFAYAPEVSALPPEET